jgi:hypothetical protein
MSIFRAHDDGDVEQRKAIAEDFAVSAVRRPFQCSGSCPQAPQDGAVLAPDLHAAGALLRHAHEMMLRLQGSGLLVAPPGTVTLTRHERRLLRATAAAQTNDSWLMDNYLFKLAPSRQVRPTLAYAVTTLAASLAAMEHWLPAFSFPTDVRPIARPYGHDLDARSVPWLQT